MSDDERLRAALERYATPGGSTDPLDIIQWFERFALEQARYADRLEDALRVATAALFDRSFPSQVRDFIVAAVGQERYDEWHPDGKPLEVLAAMSTHRPVWVDDVPTGWCQCGESHPHP